MVLLLVQQFVHTFLEGKLIFTPGLKVVEGDEELRILSQEAGRIYGSEA